MTRNVPSHHVTSIDNESFSFLSDNMWKVIMSVRQPQGQPLLGDITPEKTKGLGVMGSIGNRWKESRLDRVLN